MTLLAEVYRRPLDPGYREAARRRAGGAAPARGRRFVIAALTVVLGLGTTAATLALRRPSTAAAAAHTLLVQQIAAEQARADAASTRGAAASAQLAALQSSLVADQDPALVARLNRDGGPSGVRGVHGPGLRVIVADAIPAAGTTLAADARVQDIDLQELVNGLWAAGAEAIAINGARLTATTAVRAAGSAILVDLRALASPYEVDAIGDSNAIATTLATSAAGEHLAALHAGYGIRVQEEPAKDLVLPGTGRVTLSYAAAPTTAASASPRPSPVPGATTEGRSR